MDELAADLDLLAGFADLARTETLDRLRARLREGRVRVLLLGEAKRGKSTLGNALVGREILPAGLLPLTSVSTRLRSCPLGEPEHAEVLLRDGTRTKTGLADIAAYVTEAGNPDNVKGVVEVTAYLTPTGAPAQPGPGDAPGGSLLDLGIDLVDTPGEGSVWAHNTSTARAAQEQMDLAVVVLSADPPVSTAERDLVARAAGRAAATFVVLNKTDRLDDAERDEVARFTRTAVAPALGCPAEQAPLVCCSALSGLRARLARDPRGWQDSGVAGLAEVLTARVIQVGATDVATSVRMAAARLGRDLLDEQRLRARALELATQRRGSLLAAFGAALHEMDAQHAEARALVAGRLTALRHALDTDAASAAERIRQRAVASMQTLSRQTPKVPAAVLLERGKQHLADLIGAEVGSWLADWTRRADEELAAVLAREQRLVDAALAELRDVARDLLDLDLDVDAGPIRLPDRSGFRLEVSPEVGWRAPLSETLARHAPARLARDRTQRQLVELAADVADKHVGRARSDLQQRLELAQRDLQAQIGAAITERNSRLLTALEETSAEPDPRTRLRFEQQRGEELGVLLARLAGQVQSPSVGGARHG